MSHLANPIGLRLGMVRFWDSTWISSKKKLFFSFFLEDISLKEIFFWFFDKYLKDFGFVFSHLKIIRAASNSIYFLIFFYNSAFEQFWSFAYSSYISDLFNNILKTKYFDYRASKLSFFDFETFRNSKKNKNNIFFILKSFQKKFKLFFLSQKNINKKILFNRYRKFKVFSFGKAFSAYNFIYFYFFYYFCLFNNSFSIMLSLLKTIFLYKLLDFKNKIFIYLLKIRGKFYGNLKFIFYQLFTGALNANVVCNYIIAKLSQRFPLFKVIDPLLKALSNLEMLKGFKIACSGRFTRKQIATYYWEKMGNISFNDATNFIDYKFSTVILKNSICGIKVWISHPLKLVRLKEISINANFLNNFNE